MVCEGRMYAMQTSEEKYDSLMCFLSENFPLPNFGVCYGGGCCKACGVVIRDKNSGAKKFVLSCELQVDDDIANKVVHL